MRISDWSSDVCSSDLRARLQRRGAAGARPAGGAQLQLRGRRVLPGRRRWARGGERGAVAVIRVMMGAVVASAHSFAAAAAPAALVVLALLGPPQAKARERSERRRGGKGCVRPCRSRLSPYK